MPPKKQKNTTGSSRPSFVRSASAVYEGGKGAYKSGKRFLKGVRKAASFSEDASKNKQGEELSVSQALHAESRAESVSPRSNMTACSDVTGPNAKKEQAFFQFAENIEESIFVRDGIRCTVGEGIGDGAFSEVYRLQLAQGAPLPWVLKWPSEKNFFGFFSLSDSDQVASELRKKFWTDSLRTFREVDSVFHDVMDDDTYLFVDQESGHFGVVMPYRGQVSSVFFQQKLKTAGGRASVYAAWLEIFKKVDFFHRKGIVHRDLSLSNLMIQAGPSDRGDQAFIIDPALSKTEGSVGCSLEQTSALKASHHAPELRDRNGQGWKECKAAPSQDIYSLARGMFQVEEYGRYLPGDLIELARGGLNPNPNQRPGIGDFIDALTVHVEQARTVEALSGELSYLDCELYISSLREMGITLDHTSIRAIASNETLCKTISVLIKRKIDINQDLFLALRNRNNLRQAVIASDVYLKRFEKRAESVSIWNFFSTHGAAGNEDGRHYLSVITNPNRLSEADFESETRAFHTGGLSLSYGSGGEFYYGPSSLAKEHSRASVFQKQGVPSYAKELPSWKQFAHSPEARRILIGMMTVSVVLEAAVIGSIFGAPIPFIPELIHATNELAVVAMAACPGLFASIAQSAALASSPEFASPAPVR